MAVCRDDGAPRGGSGRDTAIMALARYIQDREPVLILTGAAGSGKSAVLNAALATALATVADRAIRLIRLDNPDKSPWTLGALSRQLLAALGRLLLGGMAGALTDREVTTIVTASINERGSEHPLVITVDDAESLTDGALEYLLLLGSPERGHEAAARVVLSGRGAFWERPWRGALRGKAMIARCVTLGEITEAEAREHGEHMARRLEWSGAMAGEATPRALAGTVRQSGGPPRRIKEISASAAVPLDPGDDQTLTDGTAAVRFPPATRPPLSVPLAAVAAFPALPVPDAWAVLAASPAIGVRRRRWPILAAAAAILVPLTGLALMNLEWNGRPGQASRGTWQRGPAPPGGHLTDELPAASAATMPASPPLASPREAIEAPAITPPTAREAAASPMFQPDADMPLSPSSHSMSLITSQERPEAGETGMILGDDVTTATPPAAAALTPATGTGPDPSPPAPPLETAVTDAPAGGVAAGRPSTRPAAVNPLAPEGIAALLSRGDALLRQGDVVAARLLYQRAVAAGSGPGATRMGMTYDPAFLATLGVKGLRGETGRAIHWYGRASEDGDSEGRERLRALIPQGSP